MLAVALMVGGPRRGRSPGPGRRRWRGRSSSRILCAAALADECGDESALIAAYGTEVGELVRHHMPTIAFEDGSRAVPVDFRRCRSTSCGDGREDGQVWRSGANLRVTAFVHVVDCRAGAAADTEAAGADCSGERAGNLYLEFWTYYADRRRCGACRSAARKGYHADDWEGVEIRIGPDGEVDERASSHDGFNYRCRTSTGARTRGSACSGPRPKPSMPARRTAGARRPHLLLVSGGSHAGNAAGAERGGRYTPARRVQLVPLEPIAERSDRPPSRSPPPGASASGTDPEADGTD